MCSTVLSLKFLLSHSSKQFINPVKFVIFAGEEQQDQINRFLSWVYE